MNIDKLVARSLVAATAAFTIHAAALAQDTVVPAGPESAAPVEVAPVAPAEPAAPQAAPANPQVVTFVDQQFPTADGDGNGTLTAAEFSAWISGLKAAEREKAGQAADPAAVKAYADGALATADKDKDQILTKPELVTFFGG